jgi:hypothetical protein
MMMLVLVVLVLVVLVLVVLVGAVKRFASGRSADQASLGAPSCGWHAAGPWCGRTAKLRFGGVASKPVAKKQRHLECRLPEW